MQETLVILNRGRTVSEIEPLAQVLQRYGDRVLVVATDNAGALRALGEVQVVESGKQAPAQEDGLNETEQMGIAAWNARGDFAKKKRRGDGLPWDTPGFDPP